MSTEYYTHINGSGYRVAKYLERLQVETRDNCASPWHKYCDPIHTAEVWAEYSRFMHSGYQSLVVERDKTQLDCLELQKKLEHRDQVIKDFDKILQLEIQIATYVGILRERNSKGAPSPYSGSTPPEELVERAGIPE